MKSNVLKERPIPMTGESVRAILAGRKTQTRRIVKGLKGHGDAVDYELFDDDFLGSHGVARFDTDEAHNVPIRCPYGAVGDRLYVKETYLNHALEGYSPVYLYRADGEEKPADRKWKGSRFMPKAAARILLEIIGVRVERLNDISSEDAEAEGVEMAAVGDMSGIPDSWITNGRWMPSLTSKSYQAGFAVLWEKINGKKHPWVSNPWVFVLEFKKI